MSSTRSAPTIEESRGDDDAAYINRMITIQRRLATAGRITLFASRWKPAWLAGAAMLGDGQDPGEHGDRPQRHARPVGLDERPRDPLQHLGVGHRPAGRAVEALAQLRAPPVHQRARPRQRHRLRHPADGARAEVEPVQPRAAGLQRRCWPRLFQWGVALHDLDIEAIRKREKDPKRDEEAAQADRAQGPQADRQGLRRSTRRSPARRSWHTASGQRDREPDAQPVVLHDHLLRPLPRRCAALHRGGARGRDPRGVVPAPDARLGQLHRRPAAAHHVAATSATRSSTTCSPTCRATATRRSRTRCARCARSTTSRTRRARCTSSTARRCARS